MPPIALRGICQRCGSNGAEPVTIALTDPDGTVEDSEEQLLCPGCTAFIIGLVKAIEKDSSVN